MPASEGDLDHDDDRSIIEEWDIEEWDGHAGETSSEDGAELPSNGRLFMPERVFVVQEVNKAAGGFRPSLLLVGHLADIRISTSGRHELQQVPPPHLQLSLRYEPPSPKFSRSCPDCVSYTLKLLQGTQFLYLLRGLPKHLAFDCDSQALAWGPLKVVFQRSSDLSKVILVLKHVEVQAQLLWPPDAAATWQEQSRGVLEEQAAVMARPASQAPAAASELHPLAGWAVRLWHLAEDCGGNLLTAAALGAAVGLATGMLLVKPRRH